MVVSETWRNNNSSIIEPFHNPWKVYYSTTARRLKTSATYDENMPREMIKRSLDYSAKLYVSRNEFRMEKT